MKSLTLQKFQKIICLIIIISLALTILTCFASWRNLRVTNNFNSDVLIDNNEFGVYEIYYLRNKEYGDISDYTEPIIASHEEMREMSIPYQTDSPNYKISNGMMNLEIIIYASLIILSLLLISYVYGIKKGNHLLPFIFIILSIIILLVASLYFYFLFPIGDTSLVESFSFSGNEHIISDTITTERSWGPGPSWFMCIISTILLIIGVVLMVKANRPEQVGDGQRKDERLGEEEGKKAHLHHRERSELMTIENRNRRCPARTGLANEVPGD